MKKSLLILIWPAMAALAADSPAWLKSEFIYETAPFPQCHASTIVETQEGMAAAWFGGLREKSPDVGIWLSRREADAWTPPQEVANGEPTNNASGQSRRWPCWNPVLFQPSAGPLLLFYKVGPSPSQWWGMLKTSGDGGRQWSNARRLPEGILGPIKNKPMQLANGDMLCGSSTEQNGWQVHFERTGDLGLSWTCTQALNDGRKIGAIQPSILMHSGGKLQALGRSQQGRLWETWSEDQGQTWTPLALIDLPNPNAGTDAITLKDGRQLLVYNHTTKGRSPLNVAISPDGRKWTMVLTLEDQPGEYSYPAVIQATNGKVHITYTWKRVKIRHVELDSSRF